MPRRSRVFAEGAVYHVHNAFARGAPVFGDPEEAERFVALLADVRHRDSVDVLAWCLLPDGYDLALRTGPVPLSRTIAHVQARFGQDHNRRNRSSGPLWRSRYGASLVGDPRHLPWLIAYVHLRPVAAGIVDDPAGARASGHGEILGSAPPRIIDPEPVLSLFPSSRTGPRRAYLRLLETARRFGWVGEGPGALPWWDHATARTDRTHRSPSRSGSRFGAPERPAVDVRHFVETACRRLDVTLTEIRGPGKNRSLSRARYAVAGLAVERWGIPTGELAGLVGRRPEAVSRWVARAGALRRSDPGFRKTFEALDSALIETPSPD